MEAHEGLPLASAQPEAAPSIAAYRPPSDNQVGESITPQPNPASTVTHDGWFLSGRQPSRVLLPPIDVKSLPGETEPVNMPASLTTKQRWQKANVMAQSVVAIRDAPLADTVKEKVMLADGYATKMVESSLAGGIVTMLVWGATIAYIVVLAVQWARSPAVKEVGTEWTIGIPAYQMRTVCKARSGCLVSNVLSVANTLGASASVPQSQAACFRMEFEEVLTIAVVFSVDPVDGISVMWDPATTNGTTSLVNGGVTVISEIRCPGNNDPACTFDLNTPVGPGTALLQHVDTINRTAEGAGQHRREWFVNMIDQNGVVLPGSTPCVGGSGPIAPAGWVQARLRINSFYNTVLVEKDAFWLFLFGTAGGAYAIFLQAGGLLVVILTAMSALKSRHKLQRQVTDDGHGLARV